MKRGLSFKIPYQNNFLWQILKFIDIENYDWYNVDSQCEVWKNFNENLFFETDFYHGKDFANKIREDHFIIFLKMQAYLKNGTFIEIHSYDQFVKSECQILLLIYDCDNVEFYIKNISTIETLYEHAINNGYSDVNYITDKNDKRLCLDIL